MGKKLISLMVFVISILLFELISSWLSGYLLHLRAFTSPYRATLIGMGAVAFVLFPAYKWLDQYVQRFAKKFLVAGKNVTGRSTGMLLAFAFSMFVLYLLYLKLWFDIPYTLALKKMAAWLLNLF